MMKYFFRTGDWHGHLVLHTVGRDGHVLRQRWVWLEQIVETFFVNFVIVDQELKLGIVLFNRTIDKSEYISDSSRYNSIQVLNIFADVSTIFDYINDLFRPQHAKGLARTTHAIGKDGAVISIAKLLDRLSSSHFVHLLLRSIMVQDMIISKLKILRLGFTAFITRCLHRFLVLVDVPIVLFKIFKHFATLESNDDFDCFSHDVCLIQSYFIKYYFQR